MSLIVATCIIVLSQFHAQHRYQAKVVERGLCEIGAASHVPCDYLTRY